MIADDDPTAQRLREAVWADPAADAPRSVFADYLLQHDDPLGELVALQLERARTGTAIGERELELVVDHGRRMLGPAEVWLRRWTLERGFLAAATPHESIPAAAAEHPLWSTVERLAIMAGVDHPVWQNTHLRSLRTLHTNDRVALALSTSSLPLPIRALTGTAPHMGLALHDASLEAFDHRGAFDNVRTLGLSAWHLERALNVRRVLESRLIGQLEHLDLTFTSVRLDDVRLWQRWFHTSKLAKFSVEVPLAQNDPPPGVVPGQQFATRPTRFLCAAIDRDGDTIEVQLDEPLESRHIDDALRVLKELGPERAHVVISDLSAPDQIEERQATLLGRLREDYHVDVVTLPSRTIAP